MCACVCLGISINMNKTSPPSCLRCSPNSSALMALLSSSNSMGLSATGFGTCCWMGPSWFPNRRLSSRGMSGRSNGCPRTKSSPGKAPAPSPALSSFSNAAASAGSMCFCVMAGFFSPGEAVKCAFDWINFIELNIQQFIFLLTWTFRRGLIHPSCTSSYLPNCASSILPTSLSSMPGMPASLPGLTISSYAWQKQDEKWITISIGSFWQAKCWFVHATFKSRAVVLLNSHSVVLCTNLIFFPFVGVKF